MKDGGEKNYLLKLIGHTSSTYIEDISNILSKDDDAVTDFVDMPVDREDIPDEESDIGEPVNIDLSKLTEKEVQQIFAKEKLDELSDKVSKNDTLKRALESKYKFFKEDLGKNPNVNGKGTIQITDPINNINRVFDALLGNENAKKELIERGVSDTLETYMKLDGNTVDSETQQILDFIKDNRPQFVEAGLLKS